MDPIKKIFNSISTSLPTSVPKAAVMGVTLYTLVAPALAAVKNEVVQNSGFTVVPYVGGALLVVACALLVNRLAAAKPARLEVNLPSPSTQLNSLALYQTNTGECLYAQTTLGQTARDLREELAQKYCVDPDTIRVIYSGKNISNSDVLCDVSKGNGGPFLIVHHVPSKPNKFSSDE